MSELSERLRRASIICEEWQGPYPPPLKDWSALMDEAAEALDALEDEDEEDERIDYGPQFGEEEDGRDAGPSEAPDDDPHWRDDEGEHDR